MFVSNDDTWNVKTTLQHVTYDHGFKLLVKKHQPKVGKKIVPVVLDLLKSISLKKLKGFFLPLPLCNTFWFKNPV
jgi:hypothetical protein